jgi:23S rRNA (cytidine1920-2'-O)/16S rRNA (cytidine1409-2'-O)-methyltransferase
MDQGTKEDAHFVSRGGVKLQHALDTFKLNVDKLTCLDVGSSTGGFVDCLLQNGAVKVYAVDTAYGEFAWKLRNDPRVVVMERTNILHLEKLPDLVDLISIDAGWTRLEKVLPVVQSFLKPEGIIVALLKPHYEADKNDLIKGVLADEKREVVVQDVEERIQDLGFEIGEKTESPILGGGGNREYLWLLTPQPFAGHQE